MKKPNLQMRKFSPVFCFAFLLFSLSIQAAESDTISVALRASAAQNRIQLRWAVHSPSAWYFTNKNGFSLVRHTIMRDGAVLDVPEKVILSDVIKPQPLNNWQYIAPTDNYAAIIAQALYGSDFEVSGGKQDISQIIALSQEQEQRYAMSLLAAEMSFPAAVFAGWGYEDYTAKKGERYLYQVIPLGTTPQQQVEIGATYIGLSDFSELPRPLDFNAVWGNGSVLLMWDYKNMLPFFNAYYLERSNDNRQFNRVSETPLTNIMDSDRMFYTDSIANGKTYFYRLQGINAFGDFSEYSDTLSGKGVSKLIYVPFIKRAFPDDKGGVDIDWEFDERGNSEIKGFELRQSAEANGVYTTAIAGIAPQKRSINYDKPLSEGYLMIAAIPNEGEPVLSFPHLFQMEDSIPPAVPSGLRGRVDAIGAVYLAWERNTEADFYGYRIYRAQTKGGELIPLNDDAHPNASYTDTISIRNLNSKVYYAVAALDRRYNQSELSEIIELEKPDVVKPSPPYITQYESDENGIRLQWVSGRDESIRSFRIYRKENDADNPLRVAEITDLTVLSYADETLVPETNYIYFIKSATKNGLESDASPEITVKSKAKAASGDTNIVQFKANRTTNGVALAWQYNIANVRSVSLYRKEGNEPLSLWQEADSAARETADLTVKRNVTYEYMLVIKDQTGKVFSKTASVK